MLSFERARGRSQLPSSIYLYMYAHHSPDLYCDQELDKCPKFYKDIMAYTLENLILDVHLIHWTDSVGLCCPALTVASCPGFAEGEERIAERKEAINPWRTVQS
jgi:hypothetical protein